jgi:hypothetical protein
MTRCKYRSNPVWHETRAVYDGRLLLVAETPSNLLIRRKGTRQVLALPWTIAHLRACTLKAQALAIEKINRRRAVKRGAPLGV